MLVSLIFVGCSSDDDSGISVGGPSGDANDDDEVVGSPFVYEPSDNLKNLTTFPVGNIVSASRLSSSSGSEFRTMLNSEYNSITAENDMKMANIFMGPDTFDFSDGDAIIAYAKANEMRVHGHALVWHPEYAIPSWLRDFDGTDEEFEAYIENYVKTTVAHFAEEKNDNGESIVSGWDVVNEYFDGSSIRNSLFTERMGTDYIRKIFQWAREADPDVKLFYNDYNIAGTVGKRNAILSMVNSFQNSNPPIPIDGIGMQMHLGTNWPPQQEITQAITDISNSGLLVHVSELDVMVNANDDISEFTLERAQEQEDIYNLVSSTYSSTVPANQQYGITIWGFRDQDSWRYNNGTDWLLLYDNNFDYKISHRGFADGL